MLVLTRYCGQSIVVGDIRVTVAGIDRGDVQLVFAPADDMPVESSGSERQTAAAENATGTAPKQIPPSPRRPDASANGVDDEASPTSRVSLRCDETVAVGEDATLMIVGVIYDIRGNSVQLGVAAPRHIPIHREEVYEAIRRSKVEGQRVALDL